MKQLLHPDPEKRMTSSDYLRHPWVQGLTASWDQKIDNAYKRHLMMNFKRHISSHFAQARKIDELELREIFNSIDIARNGVLDANELRMALRSAGETDEEIITKIVSSMNFQRNGSRVEGVTFDEFKRMMMDEE
jgi:Ca2+-binding EF-hand superfamily protein